VQSLPTGSSGFSAMLCKSGNTFFSLKSSKNVNAGDYYFFKNALLCNKICTFVDRLEVEVLICPKERYIYDYQRIRK
jgi:hypothetical protein